MRTCGFTEQGHASSWSTVGIGTSAGDSVAESVGLLYHCKSHTGDLAFIFWSGLPGELTTL